MSACVARQQGRQEEFPPARRRRKPRETRYGVAFVAERSDGAVLLRTRPSHGLLGGMAEPPGSDWRIDYPLSQGILDAPLEARWKKLPGTVRHVFTHFPLELTIFYAASRPADRGPGRYAVYRPCRSGAGGLAQRHAQGARPCRSGFRGPGQIRRQRPRRAGQARP